MSLQSRLSTLITAIGTDIKELKSRKPTILESQTSVSDTEEAYGAVEWWTSIPSLVGKLVAINPIISSTIQNYTELWLRVKHRDGSATWSVKILDSLGNSDFARSLQMTPARLTTFWLNGWRDYDGATPVNVWTPTYWKDAMGVVHLAGLVDKNGGSWVVGQNICQLPVGYRPLRQEMFLCPAGGAASGQMGYVRIDIDTFGVMIVNGWQFVTNPVQYLSISPIHFRAA